MTVTARRPTRSTWSTGWVPFALVTLVLVPAVAGSLRLVEVFGGAHVLPANPRITASPVPVVVHIVCAVVYAVLGAFQFSASLRRRRPDWHRVAGRALMLLGLAVAFSALWLTLFYPSQPGTGELAYVFRLAFGSAMAASIILGFTAIRRGNIARHRAWMTRAYALALGAGTQVFTQGIGNAVFGTSTLVTDLSLGAGWAINLAVAEYVIRRPRTGPINTVTASAPSDGRRGPGAGRATPACCRSTSANEQPSRCRAIELVIRRRSPSPRITWRCCRPSRRW